MEWQLVFMGQGDIALALDESPKSLPDLGDALQQAAKEIRKAKKGETQMTVSVNSDHILCRPTDSSGSTIYQPIGKVLSMHPFSEGTLMKSHYLAYAALTEDSRLGGPNAKYICFLFKCKNEDEASGVAFAIKRTLSGAQQRPPTRPKTQEQLEAAVKWWNNSTPPLLHYAVNKDLVVSGNMKVQCQVDATLRTATKMVRLTTNVVDDKLVEMLAEKFNLSAADYSKYAVYDRRDSGEQIMLEAGESPLLVSLQWCDPSEGAIWLQRLPAGLVRVNTTKSNTASATAAADMGRQASTVSGAALSPTSSSSAAPASASLSAMVSAGRSVSSSAIDPQSHHAAAAGAGSGSGPNANSSTSTIAPAVVEPAPDAAAGGPLLPYSPEDEDLLLSVMIARQSGTGLGFKLTPAYLLQMCIAYCGLNLGEAALHRLLQKVVNQIGGVVANNPNNPDMLLFWICNSMKLTSSLSRDPVVGSAFHDHAKASLDATVDTALKHLKACAASGQPLPAALDSSEWSSQAELRAVIEQHYRALDSNMNADSLNEVVQRITQAMPSPARKAANETTDSARHTPNASTGANGSVAPVVRTPELGPMTSTPVNAGPMPLGGDVSAIQAPVRGDSESSLLKARVNGLEGVDMASLPRNTRSQSPLPAEWEELLDQETQHRFFANHVTRQTSWTDPRDRLTTVTLIKGERGLGLGISGAKRTWDDRLVLGIFVSSLVPGSAAAVDGTLHEGDEVLEVNGHSLIGVSREGAIEFLKQVRQGEKVALLVAQEPIGKVALKQTAL